VRTMRIISQNGEINLPYEMTALIVSENYIQAVFAGGIQQSPYVMASYSSKKSCADVMSTGSGSRTGTKHPRFYEAGGNVEGKLH
jgi:hypothetical protein